MSGFFIVWVFEGVVPVSTPFPREWRVLWNLLPRGGLEGAKFARKCLVQQSGHARLTLALRSVRSRLCIAICAPKAWGMSGKARRLVCPNLYNYVSMYVVLSILRPHFGLAEKGLKPKREVQDASRFFS
jgi:hypothetical protein